jgi:hypothetical protein
MTTDANVNYVQLTEDLVRGGKTYPKGTKCLLIGMLSPHDIKNNGQMALGIRLENEEFVEVTTDVKNCTDFKWERLNSKA